MRGICKRIGVFALVLMLMTSMVAPTVMAASSTTASTTDDACDEYASYGQQLLGSLFSGSFDTVRDRCKAKELVSNATWSDNYASALAQNDIGKTGQTAIQNHLNDSKTFARTLAKAEAVKAFNNGTNKSQTKALVNESINEYYSSMQANLLETYSSNAVQAYYVYSSSNQSGVPKESRTYIMTDTNSNLWSDNNGLEEFEQSDQSTTNAWWDPDNAGTGNKQWTLTQHNTTLLDGTSKQMDVLTLKETYSGSYALYYAEPTNMSDVNDDGTERTFQHFQAFYYVNPEHGANITDATDVAKSNSVEALDEIEYIRTYENIDATASDVKANAALYVDRLYATYNQSEGINVTEVLDPITLAAQFNTDYNSTGYHGWIASELGLTGLEGDINSSFAIEYTPRENQTPIAFSINGSRDTIYAFNKSESANLSGTLMTDWAPSKTNGSLVNGTTYDTSNADSPVLFIEQVNSDSSRVVTLNGTFTITALTNVKTGENINETTLEEQNQQTWDANSTKQEIEFLLEWRNKSTDINTAGGGGTGGGGGGFNFDFGAAGFGFIAIAGGALLLLSNRS